MFAQTTIVALFASLVAAQHAPVGEPKGNPITRPLNEVVPACKPFEITWQPTTSNSVSLILLRGPSTNVKPLSTIVTGIANSGKYSWTPSSGLEADVTHYGLQLIDDVTGQYQYSTQFGISKGPECNGVVASSARSTEYGGGYPTSSVSSSAPAGHSASTPAGASTPAAGYGTASASTPAAAYGTAGASTPAAYQTANGTTLATKPSAPAAANGYPVGHNSTYYPSALRPNGTGVPSATKPVLPESTGAASSLQAGLSFAGVAAALAFML